MNFPTRFLFLLLCKVQEAQNDGSPFLPTGGNLLLRFGEDQTFFSRRFNEVALIPTRVSPVLTDGYLMASKSVTAISFSSAGKCVHYFFLEQALGILGAETYFSFQWRAAVGHLATAGAIPHSRGMGAVVVWHSRGTLKLQVIYYAKVSLSACRAENLMLCWMRLEATRKM